MTTTSTTLCTVIRAVAIPRRLFRLSSMSGARAHLRRYRARQSRGRKAHMECSGALLTTSALGVSVPRDLGGDLQHVGAVHGTVGTRSTRFAVRMAVGAARACVHAGRASGLAGAIEETGERYLPAFVAFRCTRGNPSMLRGLEGARS
jgi:hypothetical protein